MHKRMDGEDAWHSKGIRLQSCELCPPLTLSPKLIRMAKTAPNTYLVPTYGPRSKAELTLKA